MVVHRDLSLCDYIVGFGISARNKLYAYLVIVMMNFNPSVFLTFLTRYGL